MLSGAGTQHLHIPDSNCGPAPVNALAGSANPTHELCLGSSEYAARQEDASATKAAEVDAMASSLTRNGPARRGNGGGRGRNAVVTVY